MSRFVWVFEIDAAGLLFLSISLLSIRIVPAGIASKGMAAHDDDCDLLIY